MTAYGGATMGAFATPPAPRRTSADVDDATWARLAPLIPAPPHRGEHAEPFGRPPVDDRIVVNTLLYLARTRTALSSLRAEPGRRASGMTCWRRIAHWRERGAWAAIAEQLAALPDVDPARLEHHRGGRPRRRVPDGGPR